MERQKVIRPAAPVYPARAELTPATARRIALAAALAAPLVACTTVHDVDGLMAAPTEPWAEILPEEGSRAVDLPADDAELDYHLELAVYEEIRDCLDSQEEAVLTEVDSVLAREPAATFEGEGDLTEVEDALAEAMAAFCGVGPGAIDDTTLVVDGLSYVEDTGF